MNLKIKARQITEVEMNVEFPIYREHCLDRSTVYSMLTPLPEGNFYQLEMWKNEQGWEISERIYMSLGDGSDLDYTLGRGSYACTPDLFNRKWKEMQNFVNNITAK